MVQILKHYGIDVEKDDIRQFARKTQDGLPICDDWVTKRCGCNEMLALTRSTCERMDCKVVVS